jgi:hypothetical protein
MVDIKTQKFCAWSGLVGIMIFFGGMVVAQMFPPPSPSLSMDEVVAVYQANANGIRLGFLLVMMSGMFVFPFVAVISVQLKRIEGGQTPILTYTQLAAGTAGILFFIIPAVPFLINAYRPDEMPEITYFMNDFSWIMLVLVWPPAFMQNLSIGFAILKDKRENPVFPRWLAFFNFWVAIGFVPACTLVYAKNGIFAWNGLLPFWIPATVFGMWFMVMLVMLLKSIKNQGLEAVSN